MNSRTAGNRAAPTRTWLGAVLALTLMLPLAGQAKDAPIRLGVTPTPQVESLRIAAREAKAQGLEVELVEFNDWNTPNAALANGDIDVNYFQHIPFLENAKKQGGYRLVAIAPGTLTQIGLYSNKYKSFSQIPTGGTVAIASDPVNGGRGLLMLQKSGLIRLKPGVSYNASVQDIVSNPKKLKIIALEATQLARSLDDVDLAQGYPIFLKLAGRNSDNALLFDGIDNKLYALQFVVQPKDANNPRIRKFIDIYQHSKAVRASLDQVFGKLYVPAW